MTFAPPTDGTSALGGEQVRGEQALGGEQATWTGLPRPAAAYIAALNAGDPDAVAACVTEDFRNEHASPAGRGCVGRAAYRERLPGFLAAFPGLRYVPDADPVAAGDRVAVPYLMTASMPEGALRIRGLWLLTLRAGLVAHRVDYWDSGAVPAGSRPADGAATPEGTAAAD
ncbi:nuclear transport factor 2 family protein [Parafrankia sp. CH37]|uniref:nuclear transport factor 2 family protein n=1 Tax=Parafrankia sp. CH37 TaxID=683308 RepID=UPI00289F3D0B|nr:nuclear transport factor 2 family protein [Parafrankia sp. CH37]